VGEGGGSRGFLTGARSILKTDMCRGRLLYYSPLDLVAVNSFSRGKGAYLTRIVGLFPLYFLFRCYSTYFMLLLYLLLCCCCCCCWESYNCTKISIDGRRTQWATHTVAWERNSFDSSWTKISRRRDRPIRVMIHKGCMSVFVTSYERHHIIYKRDAKSASERRIWCWPQSVVYILGWSALASLSTISSVLLLFLTTTNTLYNRRMTLQSIHEWIGWSETRL